jgi:hypothetical protein
MKKKKDRTPPKKKRGPPPTGKGAQVQVRLQPHELEKVDARAAREPDKPSRAEMLRRMAGFEPAPVKRGGRRAYVRKTEDGAE